MLTNIDADTAMLHVMISGHEPYSAKRYITVSYRPEAQEICYFLNKVDLHAPGGTSYTTRWPILVRYETDKEPVAVKALPPGSYNICNAEEWENIVTTERTA